MFAIPFLIAAGTMTLPTIAVVGGLATLAAGGAYFAMKGDSRVESRREKAIALSRLASEEGFPHIVPILDAYAVGDYSGVLSALHAFAAILLDPVQRRQAFESMLAVQVKRHLAQDEPEKRKKFDQLLGEHGFTLTVKPKPAV